MKEAIKKAIEGGYQGDEYFLLTLPEYAKSQIWLDPLFWQALGKAMGWKSEAGSFYDGVAWQEYWHRFIDHLAEGKDVESFFSDLLANKN